MGFFFKLFGELTFSNIESIRKYLNITDSNIIFDNDNSGYLLLNSYDNIKLWLITSTHDMFILRDNGDDDLKCIYRRSKEEFKKTGFIIVRKNNIRHLYINNTTDILPINHLLGNEETIISTINKLIEKKKT